MVAPERIAASDDQGVPVAYLALRGALEGELDEGGIDRDDGVLAKLRHGAGDLYF
jgi:hypothetical protein